MRFPEIYLQYDKYYTIDYFRDISMDCQTTDITHFAVVFHYDVTTEALETIRSTANNL